MAEFTPITMKRKRDGSTRKVTTAAEQVAAAFDGFTAPAPKAPAKKAASKSTGGASKTAAAGGPVAKTATAKVAASAATPAK